MKFFGYHGVNPQERTDGQTFVVDVVCGKDLRKAGVSDELEMTSDYGKIYSPIKEIVEGPPFKLIETVGESIATSILDHFDVDDVMVREQCFHWNVTYAVVITDQCNRYVYYK